VRSSSIVSPASLEESRRQRTCCERREKEIEAKTKLVHAEDSYRSTRRETHNLSKSRWRASDLLLRSIRESLCLLVRPQSCVDPIQPRFLLFPISELLPPFRQPILQLLPHHLQSNLHFLRLHLDRARLQRLREVLIERLQSEEVTELTSSEESEERRESILDELVVDDGWW